MYMRCPVGALISLSFIVAFLAVPFAGPASAHRPDVALGYDPITQRLVLNVTHPVTNGTIDYINRTEFSLNDRPWFSQNFTNQTDTKGLVLVIEASPPEGSIVSVRVYSKAGGVANASVEIPRNRPIPNTNTSGGDGPSMIAIIVFSLLLIAIPVIVLIWWDRKARGRAGNH